MKDAPTPAATFDLITRDRMYTLSAPNASFMAQWVDAIVTALHDLPSTSRSSHLDWSSSSSSGKKKNTKKNDDSKIRSALLVLESLEMVESQTYTAFCTLMDTKRPSSVGKFEPIISKQYSTKT